MDSDILNADEEFKHFCAGQGCNKQAFQQMTIKFVHKSGWFCESCAAGLVKAGLVEEMAQTK